MEIGSFIELDLRDSGEYFDCESNMARLNSGRSGIYHSARLLGCSIVYLPYYLCPTVKAFLYKKGIEVRQYRIDENFSPELKITEDNAAILIVNFFGILSVNRIKEIASRYPKVIIDNCAGFFNRFLCEFYNVFSTRKFFGVPDGCYVLGPAADKGCSDYAQDNSSDTAAFLLKRIEQGSSKVYHERMLNEERLDKTDITRMSVLTRKLLNSIDYGSIKDKRLRNFHCAHALYGPYNLIDPLVFMDDDCVPMVYPLVFKDSGLVLRLKERNVYTGRWWLNVLDHVGKDSFEAFLSQYMVPMPIDQRYGPREIEYCFKVFKDIYHYDG